MYRDETKNLRTLSNLPVLTIQYANYPMWGGVSLSYSVDFKNIDGWFFIKSNMVRMEDGSGFINGPTNISASNLSSNITFIGFIFYNLGGGIGASNEFMDDGAFGYVKNSAVIVYEDYNIEPDSDNNATIVIYGSGGDPIKEGYAFFEIPQGNSFLIQMFGKIG